MKLTQFVYFRSHFFCLVSIGLLAYTSSAQEDDKKKIKTVFDNYKSAILEDRGEEAVTYVDQNTISYYDAILKTTIEADSTTTDALPILDKLMVVSIRHRTPPAKIKSFDGKQLLRYAIQEGMVGKNSVENIEMGAVKLNNTRADGTIIVDGQETPMTFGFTKEGEAWKVDLTSAFAAGTTAFKTMIAQNGQSENDFIIQILTLLTQKAPTSAIWQPVE